MKKAASLLRCLLISRDHGTGNFRTANREFQRRNREPIELKSGLCFRTKNSKLRRLRPVILKLRRRWSGPEFWLTQRSFGRLWLRTGALRGFERSRGWLLKIATFNVNGITARLPNLLRWLGRYETRCWCAFRS